MLSKTQILIFADQCIWVGIMRKWYQEAVRTRCESTKIASQRSFQIDGKIPLDVPKVPSATLPPLDLISNHVASVRTTSPPVSDTTAKESPISPPDDQLSRSRKTGIQATNSPNLGCCSNPG